jgi:ankyrin repeat protein
LHTNIEVVKLLISYGAAPRPHTDPMVSLSRSLSPGNKNSKRPSIDRKESSSTPPGGHRSAILVAAEKDKWDIVELLAKQGADPNEKSDKSQTTLQLATIMNRKDIMQVLIRRGADVNLQGGKYGYALIAAAFEGHPTAAKNLLDAGANINLQSSPYGTALNAAVLNGYLNVVKFLLERGADTQPGYALDTAVQRVKDDPENNNRRAIVRSLEAAGAKPGPSDRKVPQWAGLFAATY